MSDPDQIANKIEKILYNAIDVSLEKIGKEIEADVVDYLDANDHVVGATGEPLRNTVVSYTEVGPGGIELVVGTNRSYAPYLHDGTRPHWAPIDAIRLWVFKKLNLKKKQLQARAYQIQRSIAKKGTKAHPFLKEPFEAYRPNLMTRLVSLVKAKLK